MKIRHMRVRIARGRLYRGNAASPATTPTISVPPAANAAVTKTAANPLKPLCYDLNVSVIVRFISAQGPRLTTPASRPGRFQFSAPCLLPLGPAPPMIAHTTMMKIMTETTLMALTKNSTSPKTRTGARWIIRLMIRKIEIHSGVNALLSFQKLMRSCARAPVSPDPRPKLPKTGTLADRNSQQMRTPLRRRRLPMPASIANPWRIRELGRRTEWRSE